MDELKDAKRRYITQGIFDETMCTYSEEERKTIFGSTDRKSYTVKVACSYMDKTEHSYFLVDAWEDKQKEVVEHSVQEAKHKFSEEVYQEYFT